MNDNNKIPAVNSSHQSKLDMLTGTHTSSIIVAILFVMTLIALILIVCIKENPPEYLITGLIGLLCTLIGYFVGSNTKKEK